MKIVRIWEGLGNQMFQYAFAKSIEHRLNEKVYLDTGRSFAKYLRNCESAVLRPYKLDAFHISLPKINVEGMKEWQFIKQNNLINRFLFQKSSAGKYRYQFVNDSYDVTEYHEDYYRVKKDTYYMGWYQNENYFHDIREILLEEFTPKEVFEIPAEIKNEQNTVSIHVRRGDFVTGNWCVPDYYYKYAIELIEDRIKNPLYIVFTDDVDWVKDNMFQKMNCLFVKDLGTYEDYQEIILMSKCKNHIIANSTFSWWGAWLDPSNEKIVVSPKEWTPRQQNINCSGWLEV